MATKKETTAENTMQEPTQEEMKKLLEENERLRAERDAAEQKAEAAEAARIDAELMAAERKEETEGKAKMEEKEAELTAGQKQVQMEKRMRQAMEEAKADKVTIRLPIATNGEDNDVFVSVNGYRYLIQRGKEVEVPRFVAEVLKNSEEQKLATHSMLEEMQKKAEVGADKQFL